MGAEANSDGAGTSVGIVVQEGPCYCSPPCKERAVKFMDRLGTNGDAYYRFEKLLHLARQRRESTRRDRPEASEAGSSAKESGAVAAASSNAFNTEKLEKAATTAVEDAHEASSNLVDQQQIRKNEHKSVEVAAASKATIALKSSIKKETNGNRHSCEGEIAAGTRKHPVMMAEVKERDPAANPIPPVSSHRQSLRRSHAVVEGYVPRTKVRSSFARDFVKRSVDASPSPVALPSRMKESIERGGKSSDPERRVRFNRSVEASDGSIHALESEAGDITIMGQEYGWERDAGMVVESRSDVGFLGPSSNTTSVGGDSSMAEAAAGPSTSMLNQRIPTFEFEVDEDGNDGVGHDDAHGVGRQFGRLSVSYGDGDLEPAVEERREGGGERESQSSKASPGEASAPPSSSIKVEMQTGAADTRVSMEWRHEEISGAGKDVASPGKMDEAEKEDADVDQVLTQRLRDNMKRIYPQLVGVLPPEALREFMAGDNDMGSSTCETETEDDSLEGWTSSDDEGFRQDENDDHGHWKPKFSFFGELYRHLNLWVTDSTTILLRSDPHQAPLAAVSESIPEIEMAFRRLLDVAVPAVLKQLKALEQRSLVERSLNEIITTLCMKTALPAFNQVQWRVVGLLFIKALSLHRVPSLVPILESRDGISRVNRILEDSLFTIEEFGAALQEILGE